MSTRSVAAIVAVLALAGCGAPSQEPPAGIVPADSIVRDEPSRDSQDEPSRDEPVREIPPRDEPPRGDQPAAELPAPEPRVRPRRDAVEPKEAVRLGMRKIPGFGRILVDGDGFVLYRYDGDAPNNVRCDAGCSKVWPPVLGTIVAPSGEIKRVDLAIVERSDGLHQITLGGAPLYRFSEDTAPGSANGHGREKRWWAVAADGSRATRTSEVGGTR